MTSTQPVAAPKGRNISAQGKEQSDAALGSESQEASNPEGAKQCAWRVVALGEIAEVKLGKMLDKAKHISGKKLPYLRNVNVRWGTVDTDDLREMNFDEDELDRFGLKAGDVLVCEGGEPGRAAVWNGHLPELKFQKAIHRVRFKQPFEPKLLVYLLELLAQTGGLERRFTGSTIKHFTREAFVQLPVPFPPFPEQRRIVSEIEKQFTRLDAGEAALRRVQANLKRYRAAVLKAACEGKLAPTESEWKRVPLKELIGKISQGWSPKCDLTRDALPDEWAIVTTTAVQSMCYIDNQGKPLPSKFAPRPQIEIKAGDFLMTRKGPRKRAGVACLVRITRERLMVCDTVYRFRCNESRVVPSYLEVALNSPSVVEAIDRQKAGINESGVSLTHAKLVGVKIPIPPLAEQSSIVAEVERRLSVVEELDAAVAVNLQRATRLRQSILQKAFGGKL